ncbi:hypothetical protein R5H30_12125 [Sulfitobacter sp. D35]|uniref:hypothetical protein n=1 Tax=Sulfitobacter sp. D35 TaxID=3083252 RepID=UPI00296E4295|nr:hypothetical protein [Sulfitobacter sp. D35]MDW4498733.1 hypothetical protein [Sulfitobacter sp. D35]
MTRRPVILAVLASGLLAACATVQNQTTGSVTVDGASYRTVTTEILQDGQPFAKTDVLVAGHRVGCNPNLAGSCEEAVRRGLRITGRPSDNPGLNANTYYALPPA